MNIILVHSLVKLVKHKSPAVVIESTIVRTKEEFLFWDKSKTMDIQVDVHMLSSVQALHFLPASYETQTDSYTVQANTNQVEVQLINQLGCFWLSQPHDSTCWSHSGLFVCFSMRIGLYTELCKYSQLIQFVMMKMQRNQKSAGITITNLLYLLDLFSFGVSMHCGCNSYA